jgi:riboflavin kinase/FMN adenylyltransferase
VRVLSWDELIGGGLAETPFAATIGVFDGLHIGHRALVERILGRSGQASAVFTFRDNPKRILSPHIHPGELSTLDQKLDLIESMSVDFCVLIDFSGDFSKLPGRRFLSILKDCGELRFLAVGADFRCGRGLDTSAEDIKAFCEEHSIGAELVAAVRWSGRTVSSSRIRKAVTEGRLEDARAMLGRPYAIDLRPAAACGRGCWEPSEDQARPPRGTYEARLDFGPGVPGIPAEARLDSEGRWRVEGSALADGRESRGLGLIRLVSRE